MGYAPYTRITTPPNPATSGTVFTVQEDTGDRFPAPPFTALTWHDQTLPTLGLDAEELTILTIDGDVMTFARGSEPIAIAADAQLAVLSAYPVLSFGDTIRLTGDFPGGGINPNDTGTLRVCRPQGDIVEYAGTQVTVEGDGQFYYDLTTDASGYWRATWEGPSTVGGKTPVTKWYVTYDDGFA